MRNYMFILTVIGVSLIAASCSNAQLANSDTQPGVDQSRAQSPAPSTAQATPAKKFTAADVAKLKWIEGTWRGMDGDKPFYERYKIEETAMVVETLKADGSVDGEPGRFELKDGEFGKGEGKQRSVASEITSEYVQFVPVVGGNFNSFRFERQPNHTWRAVLEWPAKGNKPEGQKIYTMEPWKP